MISSFNRRTLPLAAALLCSAAPVLAQEVTIIQPGAPGADLRELSQDEAVALARNRFSPADVAFMQGMIVHHQQAVDMAVLVKDRTNLPEVVKVAELIEASQADEIAFMSEWLTDRGQSVSMMPMGSMDHANMDHASMDHASMDHASMNHAMMGHADMAGMASPAQMAELATLSGTDFDRMFLALMIEHHKGALTMVEELYAQPGSAADPVLYEFANEIVNGQSSEITRMNVILAGLSDDPRATLAAGFLDAEEAIAGLRHVAFLQKPAGFFDPANPAGLRPEKPAKNADGEMIEPPAEGEEEPEKQFAERAGLLSFANTDLAFSGDLMVAGSYHGFNAYRLGEDGVPVLVSSVVCPGGQGDVSIVGDILIMSVEQTRGRVDCGLQGVEDKVSPDRFRGLRIFDISDITRPRQVGQVQTCRGSHTHSVVSETPDSLIVYNSGTGSVRDEKELSGCIGDIAGDERTAMFRIDVVEIPKADPSKSRIISSPAVFADPETGVLAGLWRGGDHGDKTQSTGRTDECHDITVFPTLAIAAGACSGNGIIFDISDPLNPQRIDEVTDDGFAYWHSATFNNDGTKVLFTDEWGGGGRPRCQASDPRTWGANAFYEIVDDKLEYRGTYKLPAPQSDKENCVAHNGSIIPVPGRDIFVQAWYQGGISVIDFTDATNPFEIAYFDRGPIDDEQMAMGGYWSAYWYNGRIYATEIARGIDVFALEPSEFLTEAEIAAAEAADEGGVFNPQTQYPVTWPTAAIEAVEASRTGG